MACCGSNKRAAVVAKARSGVVLPRTEDWLPFPAHEKPPGGWNLTGIRAVSADDALDQFIAKLKARGTFVSVEDAAASVARAYCSRVGMRCREVNP